MKLKDKISKKILGACPEKKCRFFLLTSKAVAVFVLFVFVSVQTTQMYFITKRFVERKVFQTRITLAEKLKPSGVDIPTTVVKFGERNLGDLVNQYSEKYKLDPVVAWALIDKESTHKHDRLRFEQGWKDQYSKKWQKPNGMNEVEYNMFFTSIGLMQVGYGLWRDFCELDSYSDLLIPEVNIDCGLKIVSSCLVEKEKKIPNKGRRLKECFKNYNGSGKAAEDYANEMTIRVGSYLLEKEEPKMSSVMRTTKLESLKTQVNL